MACQQIFEYIVLLERVALKYDWSKNIFLSLNVYNVPKNESLYNIICLFIYIENQNTMGRIIRRTIHQMARAMEVGLHQKTFSICSRKELNRPYN